MKRACFNAFFALMADFLCTVRRCSPTKKELMAGIGEADNAFAYANAIQNVRFAFTPCICLRLRETS